MSDIPVTSSPASPPADLPPASRRAAHQPRPAKAFVALYRLLIRNQVTRGRVAALAGLGIVGILVGFLLSSHSRLDATVVGTRFVNGYGLSLLTPVVALVFGAGALGDLVDDQSLVYLWLPPVPRPIIALAAWCATLTVCVPFVLGSLVLIALATGGGTNLVIGTLWSGLVAMIAYTGVFTALGLRFKRALVWGLVYLLIWETFIARAGSGTARLSILSYARSILSAYTGVGLSLADRDLTLSYIVPVVLGFIGVAYTARRLHSQEID